MSNLTIQSTPKSFLQQYPLSTGQISCDEEGLVVGNSGDLQTALFENTLNSKLGVENLDEAKNVLDNVPMATMPPSGGITFITDKSSSISVRLKLCVASTQVQTTGDVKINWGDGSAIQTYTIANPGPTTCSKTAAYTTIDQKLVTITCVTSTHSILYLEAPTGNILSIDGRNCPKLTTLDVQSNTDLKYILGFDGIKTLTCNSCTNLTYLPSWSSVDSVSCSSCTSLTYLPNWKNVTNVYCTSCTGLTSLPNWENVKIIGCTGCTNLLSLQNWSKLVNISFSLGMLSSIPLWNNVESVSIGSYNSSNILPLWPNITTFSLSSSTVTGDILPMWEKIISVSINDIYGLSTLPNWPTLTSLTLYSCAVSAIPSYQNLLTFSTNYGGGSDIIQLPALPKVTSIICQGNSSTSSGGHVYTPPLKTDPATWNIGGDPWPMCTNVEISFQFVTSYVTIGSNATYLNNFYSLLHDWSADGSKSGTLKVSWNNTGYAASDKTIATNKDWTVS